MGWQFTVAEFTGGPVMIVLIAVLFRLLLRDRLLGEARRQADRGRAGSMEGHAAMDMSVRRPGPFKRRLFSGDGYTAVAHVFVMEGPPSSATWSSACASPTRACHGTTPPG